MWYKYVAYWCDRLALQNFTGSNLALIAYADNTETDGTELRQFISETYASSTASL